MYPASLFDEVIQHVEIRKKCWDCGTGNGQAATELARHFDEVIASDISTNQLAKASRRKNIVYINCSAESTPFSARSFDLITAAQAAHWFNVRDFSFEVQRTLKEGGVLALWGYGLVRSDTLNDVIDKFYYETLKGCWPEERRYIEAQYAEITFPFQEIISTQRHHVEYDWTTDQLMGYFGTWSAVNNYKREHAGRDPLKALETEIIDQLKSDRTQVEFPIFLRMWKKKNI